jgi:hypothetical protein
MKPIRCGRKIWGESDLDGWLEWATYPPEIDNEEIYEEWPRRYCGPGQFYAHKACIKRTNKIVFVAQFQGYNI